MNYIMPDYHHGLVNVANSILKRFGVSTNHESLGELDYRLSGNYRNVVLFLFDGLGYNILKDNKSLCPFLYKHLVTSISSTFPSTTMAARTTVESGLNPVEHGWLGWDMYFKEFDDVITLTTNVYKGTDVKPANYHVAKTLLSYESVVEKVNKVPGCHAEKLTVYSNHPNESLKKMGKKIKKITKNGLKNYVYAYYNEPDRVMHHEGVGSSGMKDYLKHINEAFEKICNSLKDTMVIAIADHGHVNVTYINLVDYPNITKMLDGKISIDDRATSFRVKPPYKKAFAHEIKAVLKDDFILMSKEEVIKNKLYGDGKENKYYRDGLGDYFAIGIGNKAIRYDDSSNQHKSAHSGLTVDEMLVPLIIVDRK